MRIEKISKLSSTVRMAGLGWGCMVCLGLLSIGIIAAFARFMPQEMITARADSVFVQLVSAVCLILSGFVFAVVVEAAKERSMGISRGGETGRKKTNNVGQETGQLFPRGERYGKGHDIFKGSPFHSAPASGRSVRDGSCLGGCADLECLGSGKSIVKKNDFDSWDLRKALVTKELSSQTRAFLEDRLDGVAIDSPMSEDLAVKWGLRVASLIDEITLLRTHVAEDDLRIVDMVYNATLDKMRELNFALLDEDQWNPSFQRAVSVVRSETVTETKILRKKACGMTFNGRVIKKQEVEVEMPFQK